MKISTLKLSALLAFLFSATVSMAQTTNYNSIGIIGTATPGAWTTETGLTRTAAGGHDWSITMALTAGEAKFRANNDWTVSWGANTFPSGTGSTNNGPNIPVTAGRYLIRFNDQTGVYSFSVAAGTKSADAAVLKLALAPNPTSGSVQVAYELPTAANATIEVQNLLGQRVKALAPVFQGAGARAQEVSLNGMAPGIYLVQLKTADMTQTSRLVVQ
ncbi:hypothetical protein GCM10027594_07410 [Hymenobacter agri]